MDTRVLSFHSGYRCRSSGACCRAGWAIPLEPEAEAELAEAARSGRFQAPDAGPAGPLRRAEGLAGGARFVLAQRGDGSCVFFEPERGRLCAIHRQLGPQALPAACRHFPRVCLLTPGGVSITLSHFCPTAAGMLFAPDGEAAVVRNAPGFPAGSGYEGLDARSGFPLLRPGVALEWESHELWEAHAVRTLLRQDLAPETALAVLAARAERARAWSASHGPLAGHLERLLAGGETDAPSVGADIPPDAALQAGFAAALEQRTLVAGAVPAPLRAAELRPPAELTEADARLASPSWRALASPVRRYLAAKAFASWCGVEAEGLRSAVAFVAAAWAVLRVAAAERCAAAGRPLDADLLREAVRDADLLLVHQAGHAALARRLSGVERRPAVYTRTG